MIELEELLEDSSLKEKDSKKIKEYFEEIEGTIKDFFHEKIEDFIEIFLVKKFEKIKFELEDINFRDYNVVFVSNHQSHLDYLLLNYLIYKKIKKKVFIAAGDNLNFFPVGFFLRNIGAFFIRRSFNNNVLYRKTLEVFLKLLFKKKQIVEFFIEGQRSRIGFVLKPKMGLMKMIFEVSEKPLLIIPFAISHEILPEIKSFEREFLGAKKNKENILNFFNIFSFFKKKMGYFYVKNLDPIIVYEKEKENLIDTVQKIYQQMSLKKPIYQRSFLLIILFFYKKTTKDDLKNIYEKILFPLKILKREMISEKCFQDDLNFFIKRKDIVQNHEQYLLSEKSFFQAFYHFQGALSCIFIPALLSRIIFLEKKGCFIKESHKIAYFYRMSDFFSQMIYIPSKRELYKEAYFLYEALGPKKDLLNLYEPFLLDYCQGLSFFLEKFYSKKEWEEEELFSVLKEEKYTFKFTFNQSLYKEYLSYFMRIGLLQKNNNLYVVKRSPLSLLQVFSLGI